MENENITVEVKEIEDVPPVAQENDVPPSIVVEEEEEQSQTAIEEEQQPVIEEHQIAEEEQSQTAIEEEQQPVIEEEPQPVVEEHQIAEEEQSQAVVEEEPQQPVIVEEHQIAEEEQSQAVVEEEEPQPVVEEHQIAEEEQSQTAIEEEHQPVEEEEPQQLVIEEEPQAVVEEEEPQPVEKEPVTEEPVTEEEPVVEEQLQQQHSIEDVPPVAQEQEKRAPKLVFIVPYRDRQQQYEFYSKHMKTIMEDYNNNQYEIYYIHQTDTRDFNRGAMKNIGFLMVKEKYPDSYKDITLVFNDIDIMPLTKNFLNYETTHNNIKHFYGFTYALGGIVSIKAKDFEEINGFPNFWAWGYEDNLLQRRVLTSNKNIDRTQFYPIMDKNILILPDGVSRIVNRKEFDRYLTMTTEGIRSIHNLNYVIDENHFVNVLQFSTGVEPDTNKNTSYDLRTGPRPFGNVNMFKSKRRGTMNMVI
jgi:hypothetical protein